MKRLISTIVAIAFISAAISPIQTYAADNYVVDEQPHLIDETNPPEEDSAQYQEEDLVQYQHEDPVQYQEEDLVQVQHDIPGQNITIQEKSDPEESDFISEPQDNTGSITSTSQDSAAQSVTQQASLSAQLPDSPEISLKPTSLTINLGQYLISADGNMPTGAILSAQEVFNYNELENKIGDSDYHINTAFDIKILVDGELWQPINFNELVKITISNIDTDTDKFDTIQVYRILDDEDYASLEAHSNKNDAVFQANNDTSCTINNNTSCTTSSQNNVYSDTYNEQYRDTHCTDDEFAAQTDYDIINENHNTINENHNTINDITLLACNIESDNEISFETEHFTIYTIGNKAIDVPAGKTYAYLMPGTNVNKLIKQTVSSSTTWTKDDYTITAIRRVSSPFSGGVLISDASSPYPVYIRLVDTEIEYYSNADLIYLNSDSSHIFYTLYACTSIDLSSLRTDSVVDGGQMFDCCEQLTSLDLQHFNTDNMTDMSFMFYCCSSLTDLDVSKFNTSKVTTFEAMFEGCSSLTSLNVQNFDTSSATVMGDESCILHGQGMFADCSNLTTLDLSSFNTENVRYMGGLFSGCTKLTRIIIDPALFKTSNVVCMGSMFAGCSALPSSNLQSIINNFDTNNTTCMTRMFQNCTTITTLNLAHFNTSSVTKIYRMFSGCSKLTSLNITSFDTTNVTSMDGMFSYCSSLTTLNLSHFKLQNVTNTSLMFSGCSKLTTLNLANWDTSNVQNMEKMFQNCTKLSSLDISSFNTSSVTTMNSMFEECKSLTTLNVNSFNTSNVTDMTEMFNNCCALTTLDVTNFNTSHVTTMKNMFDDCDALQKLDLRNFVSSACTNQTESLGTCIGLKECYYSENCKPSLNTTDFRQTTTMIQDDDSDGWPDPNPTYLGYGLIKGDYGTHRYIRPDYAVLYTGTTLNKTIKSLVTPNAKTSTVDTTIKTIKWSKTISTTSTKISAGHPVYARYIGNAVYLQYSGDFPICIYYQTGDIFKNMSALETTDFFTKFKDPAFGVIKRLPKFNYAFYNCTSLKNLDLSMLDTSQVDDMDSAFRQCTSLEELDISSFDVSSLDDALTGGADILTADTSLKKIKAPKTIPADRVIALPAVEGASWYIDDDHDNAADSTETYTSFLNNVTNTSHTYIRSDIEGFSLPVTKAYLVSGQNFNKAIKTLAGTTSAQGTELYNTVNTTITAIKWSDEPFTSDVNLSAEGLPVYARITGTAIELYTDADKVYFNKYSSNMFCKMKGLSNIDFISKKINTSKSTDFGSMFNSCSSLTSLDLSNFNTSSGTNFQSMFYGCSKLTSLDLSNFDTSSGKTFGSMFNGCGGLTSLDISGFKTPSGTDFNGMFNNCSKLTNLDVSSFNTSSGTNFSYMFFGCKALTSLDLSNFDTSSGTNFGNMFNGCSALTSLDISGFNTSKGTNFEGMFNSCSSLASLDTSNFDTSSGTSFQSMFYNCRSLASLDVSGFVTSSGTNFSNMFKGCSGLASLNVSGFNTSSGTDFNSMFKDCSGLTGLDLSNFDTSNGTNFNSMFFGCSNLTSLNINNLKTSNSTNFGWMFNGCKALTSLNLSSFDTSNGTDFSYMFQNCIALTSLDVSSFNTSKVTSNSKMFIISDCNKLQKFSAPKTNSYDIALPAKTGHAWYLDDAEPKLEADTKTAYTSVINPVTDQPHTYIRSDIEGFSLPVLEACLISGPEWRTALYELAGNSYSETSGFINNNLQTEASDGNDVIENTITDIIWADNVFDTTTDPSAICVSTSEGVPVYARMSTKDGKIVVELYTEADVVYLNSNCRNMFQCYDALETISFLTDKIDASQVTDAFYMFAMGYIKERSLYPSLPQIKRLDLSRCTFENTTKFTYMFYNCNRLDYLDIHNFETTNGTDFGWMFQGCGISSLDLSNFNTSNGINFSGMFYYCKNLTSLDLSSFNTSNGQKFTTMFYNCTGLTSLNLSNFNTSNGTSFSGMFANCYALANLNVSNFDTSKCTNFSGMFVDCRNLTSLDVSNFDTSSGTDFNSMFYGCGGLTSLNIRNFAFSDNAELDYMLSGCDNLSTIYGLTGVTSLGDSMFATTTADLLSYINDDYAGDFDAFWEEEGSYYEEGYDELKAEYESAKSQEISLTVLYFADYEDFTSDCWFNYDWAADGRSVCIYNVSIPAIVTGLDLSTEETTSPAGTLNISVEKYVSDEAVEITTSPVLKLTSTTDPNGYLTYMFTQEDTSKTYSSLKDEVLTLSGSNTSYTDDGVTENATGPKYSAKENYVISIFQGQDQKLTGLNYAGNLVLNFQIANRRHF